MTEFVLILCILIFAALFLVSVKRNYYHFRNIFFLAAILFCSSLLTEYLLYDMGLLTGVGSLFLLSEFIKRVCLSMAVLLSILCIVMSISNVALIRHEGLKAKNVAGAGLEILFVAATVAVYLLDVMVMEPIASESFDKVLVNRCIRLLTFLYAYLCYLDMILVGIFVMGYLAARQQPKYDKDVIIIPGCSIKKDGGLLPLLKGRTNRAIRYAWDQEIACGKKVLFVPSGGQGPDEVMSEGSAMELYLLSHAAETDEVYAEKKSRNTYENFYYSKKIIDGIVENPKVAFATTNYHVLRCGMLAHRVGIEAEGIASSTKWYFWPNGFAREVIAIFAMTKRKHIAAAVVLAALCFI